MFKKDKTDRVTLQQLADINNCGAAHKLQPKFVQSDPLLDRGFDMDSDSENKDDSEAEESDEETEDDLEVRSMDDCLLDINLPNEVNNNAEQDPFRNISQQDAAPHPESPECYSARLPLIKIPGKSPGENGAIPSGVGSQEVRPRSKKDNRSCLVICIAIVVLSFVVITAVVIFRL